MTFTQNKKDGGAPRAGTYARKKEREKKREREREREKERHRETRCHAGASARTFRHNNARARGRNNHWHAGAQTHMWGRRRTSALTRRLTMRQLLGCPGFGFDRYLRQHKGIQ